MKIIGKKNAINKKNFMKKIVMWSSKKIRYEQNRINTDINYRLIKDTRRKIHHALNGKSKSSSTVEILGIDIETLRLTEGGVNGR